MSILFDNFSALPEGEDSARDADTGPVAKAGVRMGNFSTDSDQVRLTATEFFNTRFVPQVLLALANDGRHHDRAPIRSVLDVLVGAMLSGDRVALARLTAECRRLHIPAEVVVDTYLPAAIDAVGARWHDDEIDILTATIAFARMQTLMRELGRSWKADDLLGSTGSVLMLVPDTDQHTLGALIATGQLRRRGVSVTLRLTSSVYELEAALAESRFDAVFVSVSNLSSLDSAAKLVKVVKRPGSSAPPVIVGGSAPAAASTILGKTGADCYTRDVEEGLRFCGLGVGTQVVR